MSIQIKNEITGYSISRGYRTLRLYHFDAETKKRVSVTTVTPGMQLSRFQKYDVIFDELESAGIAPPKYTRGTP